MATVSFESVNLGILLGQSAALKDRLLDRHLLPLGITAAQFMVLRAIAAGQSTAGALSHYLSIHSAAMTRMLGRLESKELIARSRDRRDLRQIRGTDRKRTGSECPITDTGNGCSE